MTQVDPPQPCTSILSTTCTYGLKNFLSPTGKTS